MYGLPKDTDLTFFLRKKLERVDVGEFQAQLHFAGDICLSVEGEAHVDNRKVEFSDLGRLEGSTVFGVTIQEGGRMNLVFTDGRRLGVLDSNADYESYQITAPGVTIVV